jgi:ribosomal protein S13
MKSKTKKIIVATVSALTIFVTGSLVGASGLNWFDQISVDAAKTIDSAAKSKTDELTTDIQTKIHDRVKEKITPEIDARKMKIQADLDAYFNQKVDTLADTQQYEDSVKDLDRIEGVLLDNYKAEIDKAFVGQ